MFIYNLLMTLQFLRLISGVENVNPFAVVVHEGQITLSPESDVWVNTEYEPANVTNVDVTIDQE